MKLKYLASIILAFLSLPNLATAEEKPADDSVTVYIFLGEECIVSQYFTKQLNELHREFGGGKTAFLGLFPNPSSSNKKIEAFRQKYSLAFPLKLDVLQRHMDKFGVKVTPEVVVFNHSSQQVLYQGRIDNTFFRVGKRRQVTTSSELRDVLLAIRQEAFVPVPPTKAVGCFISPLGAGLKNVQMCAPDK
ncbi:MAG TPA: redoxin domain-containing protein [Bacteroidetes bacterium]|nr:redoxin domain-containing protein [Bacteroidota bacterium]